MCLLFGLNAIYANIVDLNYLCIKADFLPPLNNVVAIAVSFSLEYILKLKIPASYC